MSCLLRQSPQDHHAPFQDNVSDTLFSFGNLMGFYNHMKELAMFLTSSLRRQFLQGVEPGKQIAVGTEQFEDLGCGIFPNIKGRVLRDSQKDPPLLGEGLYVLGWLKREQTGIIGTNLYGAEETVARISEDVKRGLLGSSSSLPKPGREGLLRLFDDRSIRVQIMSLDDHI
ncbi:NAD(P)-binding domain containing protein [Parasponia andersonii]|uniref:NAD(P)-binding domain containing protein n=1 Tax=Parasponia andersonii TaxID=3476 RepID=A0A2P5CMK4_PARAD|nr:NAD(P)-binding domain containing protein [Parasponia andersonii]